MKRDPSSFDTCDEVDLIELVEEKYKLVPVKSVYVGRVALRTSLCLSPTLDLAERFLFTWVNLVLASRSESL